MSKEKHQEHDAAHEQELDEHKKRAHKEEHGANAQDASDHQRKAPTAGVRSDTRWGDDEEMFDIKGRIIGISVHGDHSEILIGAGRQQGVHVGMTGYLMNGDTYLSELDVIATNKNTTRAIVKATPDQIREHINDAVINPSSVPKKAATKAHDFKTRVIKYSIEGGRTKVTIAGGTAYGVHAGDEVIMLDENGKRMPGGHFIVEEAEARTASAFVELIPDEVIRCKSVVVNP